MNQPWHDQALCSTTDPDVFFPPGGDHVTQLAQARTICQPCPVQNACLQYALTHDVDGIWAGTSRNQRDKIRRDLGIRLDGDTERGRTRTRIAHLLRDTTLHTRDIAARTGVTERTVERVRSQLQAAS